MIGNNELHLNGATMQVAVQMWLDATFKEGQAPRVVSVLGAGNSGFVVKLAEKDSPK